MHEPEGLLSIWLGDIVVLQMQHESTECKNDAFGMCAGHQQCMGGSPLMVSRHYALQKAQDARNYASKLLCNVWHQYKRQDKICQGVVRGLWGQVQKRYPGEEVLLKA